MLQGLWNYCLDFPFFSWLTWGFSFCLLLTCGIPNSLICSTWQKSTVVSAEWHFHTHLSPAACLPQGQVCYRAVPSLTQWFFSESLHTWLDHHPLSVTRFLTGFLWQGLWQWILKEICGVEIVETRSSEVLWIFLLKNKQLQTEAEKLYHFKIAQ